MMMTKFDYEEMLRQEIQNRGKQDHISFFGFTGTPKEKTLELFGTKTPQGQFVPFHIYSMYQSIHEDLRSMFSRITRLQTVF